MKGIKDCGLRVSQSARGACFVFDSLRENLEIAFFMYRAL
jgi:hypothetical protein